MDNFFQENYDRITPENQSRPRSYKRMTHQTHVKNKKTNRPDRGIETMFRITSSNQQRLSDMADKKAQLLITVNAIILSAIISLVLRSLSEHRHLIVPFILLVSVSISAIIFAIRSTRPELSSGVFTRRDLDKQQVNLLFFGNFYNMPLTDFNDGMVKMMADKDFLYGSMIRDLYSQGVALGRRYRQLNIAYNIFMYGLIIAVFAFVVASTFF